MVSSGGISLDSTGIGQLITRILGSVTVKRYRNSLFLVSSGKKVALRPCEKLPEDLAYAQFGLAYETETGASAAVRITMEANNRRVNE